MKFLNMFKKIEVWVVYLLILLSLVLTISFGVLVRQELVGNKKLGWISKLALSIAEFPVTLRQAIGSDLILLDRFPQLSGFSGRPLDDQKFLLLSRYDGEIREGVIELIDLTNFEIVHVWNPDMDLINNELPELPWFKYAKRDHHNKRARFNHPKLTSNGEILFINSTLHKIDACSKHIFSLTSTTAHHSIEIDNNNNIWVPTSRYKSELPNILIGSDPNNYSDHAITKVDPKGNQLYSKSVAEIFLENDMDYLLFSTGDRKFDSNPIHLNDIQPVLHDGPYFKEGDVFLSLRHQSMIILYRPESNEIIWKGAGKFYHQHDVDILDDRRISLFNNNSKDTYHGDVVDGFNEIIIYDFNTNKYHNYLQDAMKLTNMQTVTEGTHEILKNDHLFVEETNFGRMAYIDSSGEILWEYVNRAKNGKVYPVSWSRMLHSEKDLVMIMNFLQNKEACNG